MLRGHESLIRLIGKRRRLEPTAVLSCADAQVEIPSTSALAGEQKRNDQVSPKWTSSLLSVTVENSSPNRVNCPICGRDIQGDDYSINSHLDLCLTEKPKHGNQVRLSQSRTGTSDSSTKKTMQQTRLSQMWMSAQQKKQMPCEEDLEQMLDIKQMQCNDDTKKEDLEQMLDIKQMQCNDDTKRNLNIGNLKQMLSNIDSNPDPDIGYVKKMPYEDDLHTTMANCHSLSNTTVTGKEGKCKCNCHLKDDLIADIYLVKKEIGSRSIDGNKEDEVCHSSAEALMSAEHVETQVEHWDTRLFSLETVIVGRKFNLSANVREGMMITTLREPENPKDQNAIKVVDQTDITIGHLPRQLASVLSCLLDRNMIKIKKGIVTGNPDSALEPVSIQLSCERIINREDAENFLLFQDMWKKVEQVIKGYNWKHESVKHQQSRYLKNFSYLVQAVLERDSHLFTQEELAFLGSFSTLSVDAQCLFVRLFQRKGPWFRVSNINYQEISNAETASRELVGSGFFSSADCINENEIFENAIKERLEVLNVPELKQLLSKLNVKNKFVKSSVQKRDDLLERIASLAREKNQKFRTESCSKNGAIVTLILESLGFCIRVSDSAQHLIWRLQRLFFLNGEQDLSAFLLADMGAIKYPSYTCCHKRKVFITRDSLLAYEKALEVAQTMDMAIETNDQQSIERSLKIASLKLSSAGSNNIPNGDVYLARFTAEWVYASIVNLGVSIHERERRYVEAVELLKKLLCQPCCPGRRGHWTVRLSMDLEHLGRKDESLEVAESGLNDPSIRNGDCIALQRRVLRLAKPPRRWKKPSFADALAKQCKEVIILGRPLNCKAGVKSRFYGYDDQQCSVEELALQYYAGDSGGGWQGIHSESGVWMTLFALLMWDILFAEVPNVFWHPFQTAPLDLKTDAFYCSREHLIHAQLERIRCGDAPHIIAKTWSNNFGTSCTGLNWERHSLNELQVMVSCVGGSGLASICHLLSQDYAGWSSGMPDLFLWRVTSRSCCTCFNSETTKGLPSSGEAKLVEVKGPRDRLSEQQRAWIHVLMEAAIPVEVCKVHEQSKSTL